MSQLFDIGRVRGAPRHAAWSLSGEEFAILPIEEVPSVKVLKQTLHERYGAPPRFQQSILHNGCRMTDCSMLDMPQVDVLISSFVPASPDLDAAIEQGNLDAMEEVLQRPQDPNTLNL